MLSHRSQWSSAMAVLAVTEHSPQTVILHAAPMLHLADCSATISGRSPATPTRFHSSRRTACWRRSSAFVTNLLLVPAMVNMLISHPRITEAGVSSVRWLGYGGSVIPEAVPRRAIAAFPNCRFQQAYGHTELSPIATILGPEYHVLDGLNAGKLTSAGRAARLQPRS